jgi:aerobic-type carbon monoxide dehydrogenase small subunit (CoxS/CutS family)
MSTEVVVNGRTRQLQSDPATPLLYVLRNELQLNGAKFGCGMGQCGACTVILDGQAVFSCVTPLAALSGRSVRTVESLGTATAPGALQAAFIKHQAAQCGYCIAGMIMRGQALLDKIAHPSDEQIRAHMEPNLCRCGTHTRILAAIREVAHARAGAA